MQNFIKKILLGLSIILLTACQAEDKNTLKVGVISGPETELLKSAQEYAKNKFNLTIKIIEFTDYLQPNAALNDGSIDANMFQHQPFLDQQLKDKHYALVAIGKTFVYPMGLYSDKLKKLSGLPNQSLVAIPNDTSNEGRALLLLQKAKLIKLNKDAGLYATPKDIIENPKKLTFTELDASQIPRSLPDVTLAAINTNYAVASGLSPAKDALFLEGKDSPYANIIVIRKNSTDDIRMKQLVEALQSDDVLKTAKQVFNNQAIPAW